MGFRKIFYKKTEEDWYPSFEIEYQGILKLVKVSYSQDLKGNFGISVFGADDIGMCIPYAKKMTKNEADIIIQKIIAKEFINMDWLEEIGFKMF